MNDQNVVSIRLTPIEADALRAAADRAGVKVGRFIREAAAREILRAQPGVRSIRRANGAELLWQCNNPAVSVG